LIANDHRTSGTTLPRVQDQFGWAAQAGRTISTVSLCAAPDLAPQRKSLARSNKTGMGCFGSLSALGWRTSSTFWRALAG